jgi:hypothetical protein
VRPLTLPHTSARFVEATAPGVIVVVRYRTVEVHGARMMRRLGVRHFAEAVRIAVLATQAVTPDPKENDLAIGCSDH